MASAKRILRCAVALCVLSPLAATSAGAAQPGAGCGSTSSAINQYCENLPSATGTGSTLAPNPSAPRLGGTLPHGYPKATRRRARKLLALPAPATAVPLRPGSVHKSAWSLPLFVIIALLVIAAAGAAAAVARRRRPQTA